MRVRSRITIVALLLAAATGAGTAQAASFAGNSGSFKLTARSTTAASGYAPTFTGNGLLGVRVPAAGQGYLGGKVPAQSELAGFYAKPSTGKASERVQQRANIPTWSTLTFADGGHVFSPSGRPGAGKHDFRPRRQPQALLVHAFQRAGIEPLQQRHAPRQAFVEILDLAAHRRFRDRRHFFLQAAEIRDFIDAFNRLDHVVDVGNWRNRFPGLVDKTDFDVTVHSIASKFHKSSCF